MDRIGFSTNSRDLDMLRDAFERGLNAIELWAGSPSSFDEQEAWFKTVKPLLDSFQIERSLHLQMFNLGEPNKGIGEEMIRQHSRELAMAEVLGAKVAVIHPGSPINAAHDGIWPVPDTVRDKIRDALDRAHEVTKERLARLAEIADGNGVRLAVENLRFPARPFGMTVQDAKESGWYRLGSTVDGLAELISVDDRLGVTLDVGHALLADLDPVEMIRKLGTCVIHVHIQDGTGEYDAHWRVGAGRVEFPAILSALSEVNYSGLLIMEIVDADTDVFIESRNALISMMPDNVKESSAQAHDRSGG